MTNYQEVHDRNTNDPMLYVENAATTGIPFMDPEMKCRECEGRFHPDDVESGECPSCDSTDLIEDEIGAIDFIGEELGGSRGTCRILVRESEAPDFFESLDRTLGVNFGLRLTANEGCDEGTRRRLHGSGRDA